MVLIISCVRAILHDESVYSEPMKFNPDRFMTPDGEFNHNLRPADAAFGFGRRYEKFFLTS